MKYFLLIISCAVAALAAGPELPPPRVPKSFPNRLHIVERATLVVTNQVKCTNCMPAITSKLLEWDHYGPGSQFISFDVEAKHKLNDTNFFVLATVTQTQYRVWFTNGDQLYIKIAARDSALPKKAGGWQ